MFGCATTEENDFDKFLGSDGSKPAIGLGSTERYFMICVEQRFGIWYELASVSGLPWRSRGTGHDQCLIVTILLAKQI